MAKPTTNTEHAFLINTSWNEKGYGIRNTEYGGKEARLLYGEGRSGDK